LAPIPTRALDEEYAPIGSSGCIVHTNEDHALKEDVMKYSCRSLIGTLTAMTLMGLAGPAAMADDPTPSPSSDVVAEQPTAPPAATSEAPAAPTEAPAADPSTPSATNAPSTAPTDPPPTTAPDPTADPSNKPSDPPAEPKREWR